jgi:choline kinase
MQNQDYKVLITTSGTGSRLGELTKDKNKVLIDINGQSVMHHLLKPYPIDVTIVITLGYLGDQVKEFLLKNFPDRKFEFVIVDNYEGPGSSLGYSLLQAKDKLQCPFVYQACDTIVVDPIPKPDRDWVGGYVADWSKTDLILDQYRTHTVKDNKIIKLNEKGISPFDSIHIGLDGIYDYKKFWQALEDLYNSNLENSSLSEVHVLEKMLKQGTDFEWIPFPVWLDTGNISALKKTRQYLKNNR